MAPNDREDKAAAEAQEKKEEKTNATKDNQIAKQCERKAEDANKWEHIEVNKKRTTTLQLIRAKVPGVAYFAEDTFTGMLDPEDLYVCLSRRHITTGKQKEALEEALAKDGHEDFVVV
ncbi:hypothetical protein LTR37_018670 [Vermiconidia calcicola]|uniref:Uncharacterized protein n=1 Tax=Vermiconidia calcicola TaxID=1690605 RepID=A0ACC3MGI6_9PEZI|nr:hypothetical protein LTR37_018670 [Vermiconidia calcicola]